MTTPAEHAATVEGVLTTVRDRVEVLTASMTVERREWYMEAVSAATVSLYELLALADRATELERERDEECEVLHYAVDALAEDKTAAENALLRMTDRAETAEARAEQLDAALRMLWSRYLLPITDEQKEQVRAALDGGTATPEPDDG